MKARWIAAGLAIAVACRSSPSDVAPARSSPIASAPTVALSAVEISIAEQQRRSAAISAADLAQRDPERRRLATRALARIADALAAERLKAALADEDPEVIAWAAYGLGFSCHGNEINHVDALVARLASWLALPMPSSIHNDRLAVKPLDSLVDALARCATPQAERTLVTLLERSNRDATRAAIGLGRVARLRGRLESASIVALIEAAQRKDPVDAALSALSELEFVDAGVRPLVLEAVSAALNRGADSRPFAIAAARLAGSEAAAPLGAVLTNASVPVAERSLAAEQLGEFGAEGQLALRAALQSIVGDSVALDETALLAGQFGALLATLRALTYPVEGLSDTLSGLASWAVPSADAKTLSVRRRLIQIRCAAATLLAGKASANALLLTCDPDPEHVTGDLAMLTVLDNGAIEGHRLQTFLRLIAAATPRVRQAGLALLATHPEVPGVAPLIAPALGAPQSGVVAAASRLLARHPALGSLHQVADDSSERAPAPTPEILSALGKAFAAERPPDQIEVRAALMAAAATLQVLSEKPRIEEYCQHTNPTLRRAAERALQRLGSASARCDSSKSPAPVVIAPGEFIDRPVTLTFVTDAGRYGITLDPSVAPVAVTRIAELAESGFYEGLALDRRGGGAVVQFGDPVGDGYGGAGKQPIPCETSPLDFQAYRVGLALSGRDTGSSQLFVNLVAKPSLYGDYPLIGWADPEWALAADGDRIRKVDVKR